MTRFICFILQFIYFLRHFFSLIFQLFVPQFVVVACSFTTFNIDSMCRDEKMDLYRQNEMYACCLCRSTFNIYDDPLFYILIIKSNSCMQMEINQRRFTMEITWNTDWRCIPSNSDFNLWDEHVEILLHTVVWWHYGGLKIFWKPCSVCLDGKKSSSKPKKRILMRWNVFVRFFGTYLPLGGAGGLEEDWSCLTMIFSPNSPIEYWWDHALKHLHYCGSPIRESVKSTWANRSTS